MNAHAQIGDNNPPDPIDEALAPFGDAIAEAENWLDGEAVESEDQMQAVDDILKQIRKAGTALTAAEESAALPLHDAWKTEKARWKPTIEDIGRMKTGLAALVNDFKKKLAAQKAEEQRLANLEAARLRREAEEAARKAAAGNIEEQREAAAKADAFKAAEKEAQAAKKDTVKGLRTVTKYEIDDHRAALHDIAANDRDAVTAFIEEYVRRNHKARSIKGVRVWEEKEAY